MELYMRFIVTMAIGMTGAGMVLTVLLDGPFNEWDVFADLAAWLSSLSEGPKGLEARAEDFMLEIEKSSAPTINTRLVEIKREQLRQISDIEERLRRPNASAVLDAMLPALE